MSFPRIAKLLPLLMALTLTAGAAEKGVLKEFAAARYDKDALVITATSHSTQPVRSTGSPSNGEPVVPGSEMRLPLDQVTIFMLTRHSVLVFTPLEKDQGKGFHIKREENLSSVRRGVTTETFTLTIGEDGTLTYGEATVTKIEGTANRRTPPP